jgi:hypothetical protein
LLLWVKKDSGWKNHRNGAKLNKSFAFVKRLKVFETIFAVVCQNILLPLKKKQAKSWDGSFIDQSIPANRVADHCSGDYGGIPFFNFY